MSGTPVRQGSHGRLVIPAEMRKALDAKEGDALLVRVVDGEVRIVTPAAAVARAQRIVRPYLRPDSPIVEDLLAERRASAERERPASSMHRPSSPFSQANRAPTRWAPRSRREPPSGP